MWRIGADGIGAVTVPFRLQHENARPCVDLMGGTEAMRRDPLDRRGASGRHRAWEARRDGYVMTPVLQARAAQRRPEDLPARAEPAVMSGVSDTEKS